MPPSLFFPFLTFSSIHSSPSSSSHLLSSLLFSSLLSSPTFKKSSLPIPFHPIQDNYPDLLFTAQVVPASWFFSVCYKITSRVMDARSRYLLLNIKFLSIISVIFLDLLHFDYNFSIFSTTFYPSTVFTDSTTILGFLFLRSFQSFNLISFYFILMILILRDKFIMVKAELVNRIMTSMFPSEVSTLVSQKR